MEKSQYLKKLYDSKRYIEKSLAETRAKLSNLTEPFLALSPSVVFNDFQQDLVIHQMFTIEDR